MDQPDIEETIGNLLSGVDPDDTALTNKLARLIYGAMGYHVPVGFDFEESSHPQEQAMFQQASIAIAFCREMFDA